MITLGIETSCDETALALIETRGKESGTEVRVINSLVHSQADLHAPYGGVFPTLAKREHGKNLVPLLEKILVDTEKLGSSNFDQVISSFESELKASNPDLFESISNAEFLKVIPKIDRIAVTQGPGLEPALWVGINFSKILSKLWNVPLIPVNHMEGHILGSLLESDANKGQWQKLYELKAPSIALLISGGHTEIIKINSIGNYEILGQTKDDAVGEAFDKTARLLGLPYPGGRALSELAEKARQEGIVPTIKLPRPMINSGDLNFSFSGLKTAVLYTTKKIGQLSESIKKEIALEFENAVTETMESKVRKAIEETSAKSLFVGGGVSANISLRKKFKQIAEEYGIPIYLPTLHISGDNALMIALVGALHGEPSKIPPTLKASGTMRLAEIS